ncbi:15937_t:CDS:2 [Funneliformis mosseae]|uniref:15937_t:CDS:1 n=1 Tax=Funneliformis mosseae TaxID=27381 RepID=A0A9N8W1M1_FUNMO|nr:15937_t:CDS:2 [Funneliformis mosseae]
MILEEALPAIEQMLERVWNFQQDNSPMHCMGLFILELGLNERTKPNDQDLETLNEMFI